MCRGARERGVRAQPVRAAARAALAVLIINFRKRRRLDGRTDDRRPQGRPRCVFRPEDLECALARKPSTSSITFLDDDLRHKDFRLERRRKEHRRSASAVSNFAAVAGSAMYIRGLPWYRGANPGAAVHHPAEAAQLYALLHYDNVTGEDSDE